MCFLLVKRMDVVYFPKSKMVCVTQQGKFNSTNATVDEDSNVCKAVIDWAKDFVSQCDNFTAPSANMQYEQPGTFFGVTLRTPEALTMLPSVQSLRQCSPKSTP